MRDAINNKWMRAAVPALLIHCSIGTVYCWSTFKTLIAEKIGMSPFAVGWAFSLAIFFLGMSAAFAGRMVEKNIHKSSLIACVCFTVGIIIFMLALFARTIEPKTGGAIGSILILAFLFLSIATILFRNKERAEEEKK